MAFNVDTIRFVGEALTETVDPLSPEPGSDVPVLKSGSGGSVVGGSAGEVSGGGAPTTVGPVSGGSVSGGGSEGVSVGGSVVGGGSVLGGTVGTPGVPGACGVVITPPPLGGVVVPGPGGVLPAPPTVDPPPVSVPELPLRPGAVGLGDGDGAGSGPPFEPLAGGATTSLPSLLVTAGKGLLGTSLFDEFRINPPSPVERTKYVAATPPSARAVMPPVARTCRGRLE